MRDHGGRRPAWHRGTCAQSRKSRAVGPHAYLTGCSVDDEVFIATGGMVFNGAVMGRASSVALGAAVHIGRVVPAGERIPIGWIAVGNPARLLPPTDVESIRAGIADMASSPTCSVSIPRPTAVLRCGRPWRSTRGDLDGCTNDRRAGPPSDQGLSSQFASDRRGA